MEVGESLKDSEHRVFRPYPKVPSSCSSGFQLPLNGQWLPPDIVCFGWNPPVLLTAFLLSRS